MDRKQVAGIRRLMQKLDEIETALLAEAACIDVLKLVAPVRQSTGQLMFTVTQNHLRTQILCKRDDSDGYPSKPADIAQLLTRYLR